MSIFEDIDDPAYIRANIAAIDALLARLSSTRVLERIGLESAKQDLEERLAAMAAKSDERA